MFRPEQRAYVRDRVLDVAQQDSRVTAGARSARWHGTASRSRSVPLLGVTR